MFFFTDLESKVGAQSVNSEAVVRSSDDIVMFLRHAAGQIAQLLSYFSIMRLGMARTRIAGLNCHAIKNKNRYHSLNE